MPKIAKLKNIRSPQQIRAYPKYSKVNPNKITRVIFKWLGSIRKRVSLLFGLYKIYENAGWHFTYIKPPNKISQKIKDFSHTELNLDKYTNIEIIDSRVKNLEDPFKREYKLKRVNFDDSFPSYLMSNLDKYSHLILPNEN